MTQIVVLPHVELCPDGAVIEAEAGKSICQTLLENDIELNTPARCLAPALLSRHRARGFQLVGTAEDDEEDLLDKAWGLEPNSWLGCQATVGENAAGGRNPKVQHQSWRRRAQEMKWTDINDIAIELAEAYPDKDPLKGQLCRPPRLGAGATGF